MHFDEDAARDVNNMATPTGADGICITGVSLSLNVGGEIGSPTSKSGKQRSRTVLEMVLWVSFQSQRLVGGQGSFVVVRVSCR
mmetsp:Transcript_16004/g.36784  ORF Transcript_16004/g.36784 Transcript_16004/m.36784 type:complete len:83 (+) Transcript_16004:204-452(+)